MRNTFNPRSTVLCGARHLYYSVWWWLCVFVDCVWTTCWISTFMDGLINYSADDTSKFSALFQCFFVVENCFIHFIGHCCFNIRTICCKTLLSWMRTTSTSCSAVGCRLFMYDAIVFAYILSTQSNIYHSFYLSFFSTALLTAVNCISTKLSMKVQDVFTFAKLIALISIIFAGVYYLASGMQRI